MGHAELPRKVKEHKHLAATNRWYTPIQLRPWVVRAMGYQPTTGEDSQQPSASPFRQFIEEIVTRKIAEHLRGQDFGSSSTGAENAARDASSIASRREAAADASKSVQHAEEALATLSLTDESFSHRRNSASLAAAQHALGARNTPTLRHPTSTRLPPSRPATRKSIMDWLMPDLANPGPRRGSRRAVSVSMPAAEVQQGYNLRANARFRSMMGSWLPKQGRWRDRRGHVHKKREDHGCYVRGALDRGEKDRRKRKGEDDSEEEKEDEEDGSVVQEDEDESDLSFEEERKRGDDRQKGKGIENEIRLSSRRREGGREWHRAGMRSRGPSSSPSFAFGDGKGT